MTQLVQELIEELKEKEFIDNNSLLELDKLLADIIASLTENYTSDPKANSVKFITDQLEDCRIKEVNYLKPEGVTIEAETFNNRGTSALRVLEGFDRLLMAGDIVSTNP